MIIKYVDLYNLVNETKINNSVRIGNKNLSVIYFNNYMYSSYEYSDLLWIDVPGNDEWVVEISSGFIKFRAVQSEKHYLIQVNCNKNEIEEIAFIEYTNLPISIEIDLEVLKLLYLYSIEYREKESLQVRS